MLFFYIRHGDPIYNPDQLTPRGKRQAEAVAKRLCLYGLDKIYSSTSTRAIQTATPTSEIMKKEIEQLDFAHEQHAWDTLTTEINGKRDWLFQHKEMKSLFAEPEVVNLGFNWYDHPKLSEFKDGYKKIYKNAADFFKTLGYEKIENTGKYKVIRDNEQRVALFAHQGFGLAFLSAVLDIPYPSFSIHFDMWHTGVTVIEFRNEDGFAIPRVLTLSNDSHIYKEGLPNKYNERVYF